ncbi:MAG: AAA domain-containing protein [Myxococcota bacterium]|nr:AAA domain-containing protein [Myxococcota bacterium]
MHPWLARLHAALRVEETAQRSAHADAMRLEPAAQIAAGVRWPELLCADETRRRGERTLHLRISGRGSLHQGIGAGDRVRLMHRGREADARVLDVGERSAEVRVDRGAPLADILDGPITTTLAFDGSTLVRMRQALERADEAESGLKAVLLPGAVRPPPTPCPSCEAQDLNESQQAAFAVAMGEAPVTLVHGPPGTGKTRLLVRVLEASVERGDRPWALADSNAATDHLALATMASGLRVLRLGPAGRMTPAARSLGLRSRIAEGPYADALAALDRDIERALARSERVGPLFSERRRLQAIARNHEFEAADVIATTLGTLARIGPELPPATVAVVDEATQAMEPGIWAAVPHVQRLVLVGDPHQLGPVVVGPSEPLGRPMLVRLMEEGGLPMPMLEVQHRMSVALQALSAATYGPRWRAHPAVADIRLVDRPGVAPAAITTIPMLWIDTAGAALEEHRDPISGSLENPGEALILRVALDALLASGVPPEDIAVLAPYSAQVASLRAALPEVCVWTINAFQGREAPAILVSWVRSNPDGTVGFVADPRRRVVATTRARCLLISVGDTATLAGAPGFDALIDAHAENGALCSVWEPPWETVLH